MDGEQGAIRADHIELFLEPGDNRLDRLEAAGTVSVAIVDKRGHRHAADLSCRPTRST